MAPSAKAPKNLREFLDLLRQRGDLAVVEAPVDPKLEVAEIHRRVIAAGGPALLFTNAGAEGSGSSMPVATNLFGTRARAELAFGHRPFELIEHAARLPEEMMPPSFGKLWGARSLGKELLKVGTKKQANGPVKEVVSSAVDLGRLPVLTTWPEDGGPFFTLPLVYTEEPGTSGVGRSNLGIYRMQVHGPKTTGMHWQIGKGGGFHYAAAEAKGEALPVTVFFGGPPALILAAVAPLPENVPELLLASLLAGDKLATCGGPGPHALLAEAEIALGGKVPPKVRRSEGPFGDHYGYYSLTHEFPVFEIEWMARRRDAILPQTVVGKPRQEDFYIGDLLQELLAPLFPLVMPGVERLWSYGETGYHSLAAAVVKERYRLEAMTSAFRILGEGQLALTKFLLVTDRPVDLGNFPATLTHVLERAELGRDLFVLADVAMDTLDYTGPKINHGSKGVLLGLGEPKQELPMEFHAGDAPQGLRSPRVFCPGCLVVGGPSRQEEPGAAERFAAHPALAQWPLVVLTDEPERAAASSINFLWTTFTRFEPAADLVARERKLVRNHVAFTPPVVIDARLKPGFPRELFCDPRTAEKVAKRWSEYFPQGGVEMGDSDRANLDASPAG